MDKDHRLLIFNSQILYFSIFFSGKQILQPFCTYFETAQNLILKK